MFIATRISLQNGGRGCTNIYSKPSTEIESYLLLFMYCKSFSPLRALSRKEKIVHLKRAISKFVCLAVAVVDRGSEFHGMPMLCLAFSF